MRICAIIQARLGSTRFPRKVLADLCGKPMLAHIVERVSRAKRLDGIIVAYPLADHTDIIAALDRAEPDSAFGIFASQGDENDLVGRYLAAAMSWGTWSDGACVRNRPPDIIVRVCADNPAVDPRYIDAAVEEYLTGRHIFYTNTVAWVMEGRGGRYVDGLGAEVFSLSRLQLLDRLTQGDARLREHPHRWFYEHLPEVCDPSEGHAARLDVNTPAEYVFIKDIYEHVYPSTPQFTVDDVLAYLGTKWR